MFTILRILRVANIMNIIGILIAENDMTFNLLVVIWLVLEYTIYLLNTILIKN